MSYLEITGKKKLEGEITVQGSKNSCLPIIVASILAGERVVLKNCPDISDVHEMLEILKCLGGVCKFEDNVLVIDSGNLEYRELPASCGKLRASIVFMGAMLALFGRVKMPYPGGCDFGSRPIDYHIEGLNNLGVRFEKGETLLYGTAENNKINGYYFFPTPSLGALENLILRAVSLDGTSVFDNCTKEPELVDFCNFLNGMGAMVIGAGTDRIVVEGGRKLSGIEYELPGDRIVAGTYLAAVSVTEGNVRLKGIEANRLRSEISYLRKTGCHVFTDYKTNEIIIIASGRRKSYPVIITGPYPDFSTDLQPQMLAAACFYAGTTVIRDSIYPMRYSVVKELIKMNADIIIDRGMAVVRGREYLNPATVTAGDLRAGAALAIAALGCEGRTRIYGTEYIKRGYEDIRRDLKILGADIEWIEDEEENLHVY